jgi:hypothetical protein
LIRVDHDPPMRELEDHRVVSEGLVAKEEVLVFESFAAVRTDSTKYRNLEKFTDAVLTK